MSGASGDDGTNVPEKSHDDILASMLNSLSVASSGDSSGKEQLLTSLDLDGIVKFIEDGKAKSIITMAGAGISTAAGIPDFRSPGTGLYDSLEEYDLPDPMAIFSLDYFREKPEPFFKVAKTFYPENYKPTITHCLLKILDEKGLLLRHYTQNIDMLEEKAGLPADKIVYAHGNFRTSRCIVCGKQYDLKWMRDYVMSDKVPKCEDKDCEGVVKPDIVFFGESLPQRFITLVDQDFKAADLLIIMGTSLVVMPFASLIHRVKDEVPRVYVNREMTNDGEDNWMLMLMGIRAGLQCGKEGNYRDVFAQGDCDDICMSMATKLKWKDQLTKLHSQVNKEAAGAVAGASSSSGTKASSKPVTKVSGASKLATSGSPPKAKSPPKKSPPKK